MRMRRGFAAMPIRICAALALLSLFAFTGVARAAEGSPFLNLDAGACDTLDDKNLQVGPPDEEIVAACASLHRRAVFGQKFSGGPLALGLSLFGFALVYAMLGAPMHGVAGLLGLGVSRPTKMLWIEAAIGPVVRAAIGVAFLAVLALPYASAAGCVGLLMLLILFFRGGRSAPSAHAEEGDRTAPISRLSAILADLINDACASAPGILGLAILSRRDFRLLGLGIALAVAASVPAVISARRRLRRDATANFVAAAALAALFGAASVADPDLAALLADTLLPGAVAAAAFAAALWAAFWLGREQTPSHAGPA